jgi:hypothetical protein
MTGKIVRGRILFPPGRRNQEARLYAQCPNLASTQACPWLPRCGLMAPSDIGAPGWHAVSAHGGKGQHGFEERMAGTDRAACEF